MLQKSVNLKLIVFSLIMAVLGHAVFLYQWTQNTFMVGIGDGIAQMMPFKRLLYDQYTSGEFFYSFSFGLGAGTYSELAYYYATSIVFIVSVVVIWIFQSLGLLGETDVLFWANASVFISIIRLAAILFITSRLFIYMRFSPLLAFLGASIYGVSGMYFRHVVFWEFFADAFLWLPLLILGIEKIFREQKPGWFVLAVALSMFDNFYFSYINFLLSALYIFFRLFIPLSASETPKVKALLTFLVTGIIGFGISAVSFIPAVYAYMNNHRPPFEQDIPWIGFFDNILFTSRYFVPPTLFIVLLCAFFLYRNNNFRFFALLSITGIVFHYSPVIASVFNGFSAPQYRWEYFLSFLAAGTILVGLENLHKFTLRTFVAAALPAAALYLAYAVIDSSMDFISFLSLFTWGSLALTLVLMFLFIKYKTPGFKTALIGFLFVWLLITANFYQVDKLLQGGNAAETTEELLTGPEYDDPEIRGLLDEIQARESDSLYRVDYMEGLRNNTPIVQDYHGVSAYSSILNRNLLYFYLYDLEIDMGRESVSRYASLGNRANLHSMLQGKYIILPSFDRNVPYGFSQITASENYTVYENEYVLPFARPASTIYHEDQLAFLPPLVREHAMLHGVVLDGDQQGEPLPQTGDVTSRFQIEEVGAAFDNGVLEVSRDSGGINLVREGTSNPEGDIYVSFHLVNVAEDAGFAITVNDYRTTRKSNASIYKTHVDDLTIRIPADDVIRIRLPAGTYQLSEIEVYEENYSLLKEKAEERSGLNRIDIDGSRVEADYDNANNEDFLILSIPYERGWSASVNDSNAEVFRANYGFIAIPMESGENEITLTYRPPFFVPSLIVSVLSFLLAVYLVFYKRRK